jgi:hypothetical protein
MANWSGALSDDLLAMQARLALSETDRGSLFARLCETEARLAEAEKLLADIDEYGKIDAWDMSEIRARIGALLYRRTDSASACPACHGTGKRIAPNKDGPPLWVACECGAVTVSEVTK